jgi:hypothetical protein
MAGKAYPTTALRVGATVGACVQQFPSGGGIPALLRLDDGENPNMSAVIRSIKMSTSKIC